MNDDFNELNRLVELYARLEEEITNSLDDAEKFVMGNNSAGTRVRKSMQTVKNLAQEIRVEVQTQKNESPVTA